MRRWIVHTVLALLLAAIVSVTLGFSGAGATASTDDVHTVSVMPPGYNPPPPHTPVS